MKKCKYSKICNQFNNIGYDNKPCNELGGKLPKPYEHYNCHKFNYYEKENIRK